MFTDNGWTGTELRSGEGIVSYTVKVQIPPGHTWAWSANATTDAFGYWTKVEVSNQPCLDLSFCHMAAAADDTAADTGALCREPSLSPRRETRCWCTRG
jgi:hypothetical protein